MEKDQKEEECLKQILFIKKVVLKTCVINHFYDSKRTNNYFVLNREKPKECGW